MMTSSQRRIEEERLRRANTLRRAMSRPGAQPIQGFTPKPPMRGGIPQGDPVKFPGTEGDQGGGMPYLNRPGYLPTPTPGTAPAVSQLPATTPPAGTQADNWLPEATPAVGEVPNRQYPFVKYMGGNAPLPNTPRRFLGSQAMAEGRPITSVDIMEGEVGLTPTAAGDRQRDADYRLNRGMQIASGYGDRATGADRLNKLFPGREGALAKFGIFSQGATPEQAKLAERNEKIRDAKTIQEKKRLESQFESQDLSEQAQVRGLASAQNIARTNASAAMAAAMAGNTMAYAKMANDYNMADKKNKAGIERGIITSFIDRDDMSPADALAAARAEIAKLRGNTGEAGAAGTESAIPNFGGDQKATAENTYMDVNKDGIITNDEQAAAYKNAMQNVAMFNRWPKEKQAANANHPLYVRSKAMLDKYKQLADKKAEGMFS